MTRKGTIADFLVTGEGPFTTVYLLHPLTDAAREWVAEHLPEDAPRLGDAIAVEHRYIHDLVDGAKNDGLTSVGLIWSESLKGKGRFINRGYAKPDDPIYSTGPAVQGRRILDPPKVPLSGKARFINFGLCKPDDPIYSTGPILSGREILKPHRKMTPEEIERNFQIARDEIARRNWKPSDN